MAWALNHAERPTKTKAVAAILSTTCCHWFVVKRNINYQFNINNQKITAYIHTEFCDTPADSVSSPLLNIKIILEIKW